MKARANMRIRRPQAGQNLLELGLLLPIFLLLLMGIFDLGRYMYLYILVGNAARAGAAYGAQNLGLSGDGPGIQAAAQNDYQSNGGVSTLNVNSSVSCGCDSAGTTSLASACVGAGVAPGGGNAGICQTPGHWVVVLSVTASGTFSALFPYPGLPASINVSDTAQMRVAPI
jgi:Flp pilus assembly protein TadG